MGPNRNVIFLGMRDTGARRNPPSQDWRLGSLNRGSTFFPEPSCGGRDGNEAEARGPVLFAGGGWRRQAGQEGSVLLEVVLALALFVAAAAVIGGALHYSLLEVERLRLNVHAGNLAVTVMSELQLGLRAIETASPEAFEPPFEMWSFEIEVEPADAALEVDYPLRRVEVAVRHLERPVVRRLVRWLPAQSDPSPAAPASTTR